jgi:hypothetical protein
MCSREARRYPHARQLCRQLTPLSAPDDLLAVSRLDGISAAVDCVTERLLLCGATAWKLLKAAFEHKKNLSGCRNSAEPTATRHIDD